MLRGLTVRVGVGGASCHHRNLEKQLSIMKSEHKEMDLICSMMDWIIARVHISWTRVGKLRMCLFE